MEPHSKNAVGCAKCAFFKDCGGIAEQSPMFDWGCYTPCMLGCDPETCDLTCPNNPHLFGARMAEIGGNLGFSGRAMKVPALRMPLHIPKIDNGSGRTQPLNLGAVALPARALIRKSRQQVRGRFKSPSQVRQHFCLSDRTPFVISCISVDDEVEMMWQGLKYGRLAEEFARLKPAAVIVPNFSFFLDDVPRIHTLYNRKRICLAAQILSEAGCRVVIPVSALTPHDWAFWYELLRDNPAMTYVAKEFQTGLLSPVAATRAIQDLAEIQDRLGRPLHPVAPGGGQFSDTLRIYFARHTIIESRSFMMANRRRLAIQTSSDTYAEVFAPTAPGEPIDDLLQQNIKARRRRLRSAP